METLMAHLGGDLQKGLRLAWARHVLAAPAILPWLWGSMANSRVELTPTALSGLESPRQSHRSCRFQVNRLQALFVVVGRVLIRESR